MCEIEKYVSNEINEEPNETEILPRQKLRNKIKTYENNRKKAYCKHGKRKSRCKECGGSELCIHDRYKAQCKQCKGASICVHDKVKSQCLECGGSAFCMHKKQKSRCHECGGGSICEHDRVRSGCNDCNKNLTCSHGKHKRYCNDCNGSSMCKHKKRKARCKICDGTALCVHDKDKSSCQECDGASICIHKKRKRYCKLCSGNALCIHNRDKYQCKDCNGSRICIHKKRNTTCIECNGSQLCNHKIQKHNCRICDPPIHPENWCSLCKYVNIRYSLYKPYCFNCYCVQNPDAKIKYQYKLKEHHLRDTLKESYPKINMVFDKRIDEGCSLRRPDVRIECLTHTLIIECDENKHNGYSCENKRTMELFQDLGNRPIVFLRFNPDSYKDEKGNTVQGCFKKTKTIDQSLQKNEWHRRIKLLKERIDHHIKNIPTKEVTIEQLFYE